MDQDPYYKNTGPGLVCRLGYCRELSTCKGGCSALLFP
jgi:hypothetical protein